MVNLFTLYAYIWVWPKRRFVCSVILRSVSLFLQSSLIWVSQLVLETRVFPRIHYSSWLEPSLFSFQSLDEFLAEPPKMRSTYSVINEKQDLQNSQRPSCAQRNQEFVYWCIPLRCMCVRFKKEVRSHGQEWIRIQLTQPRQLLCELNLNIINHPSFPAIPKWDVTGC